MDNQTIPAKAGSPTGQGGNDHKTGTIIISVVVSVSAVLMLIISICFILRKRNMRKQKQIMPINIFDVESLRYDFHDICTATNYFAEENKLGQGRFGSVYKGELPNGEEIAVKRLSSKHSGNGDVEFKHEVWLVAQHQHPNVVKLIGFCIEGTERLLVYEYMPNSRLDHLIFDPVKRAELDWEKRFKIIVGVAKGLDFLHKSSWLRFMHRDVKASNILLDAEMNPKISEIRRRRTSQFVMDETQRNISSIDDTNEYMAPEYLTYPRFLPKSDVFSFGVLVLQIVNGERNVRFTNEEHSDDLPSYAWKNWQKGTAANLIDPILKATSGSMNDIMRCIHIALLCVATDRPAMSSVLLTLNSLSLTLPVPSETCFLWHSRWQLERLRRDEERDSRTMESTVLLKEDLSMDR